MEKDTIGNRLLQDSATSVQELRDIVSHFVNQRSWRQFHNPKDLAISISLEANELLEHVQWLSVEELSKAIEKPVKKEAMQDEIADIQIYLLSMCDSMGINLSNAVYQKIQKNNDLRIITANRIGRRSDQCGVNLNNLNKKYASKISVPVHKLFRPARNN